MIPLLITMDLELARDHDISEQEQILVALRRDMARLGIPLSIFCTSDAAERFASETLKLSDAGHEIACHGMTHGPREDFSRMDAHETAQVVATATSRIEALNLPRPRCFRGPGMSTSATTQQCLIENGYLADFSVCPQRLDFFIPRGGNFAWFSAPRRPYSPSVHSPYRRGDLALTVVPLSGLGVPFISGVMYLFGLSAMKLLYRALLREASWFQCPIVYLFHSYEFCTYRHGRAPDRRLHHRFYRRDPSARYADHLDLFTSMLSDPQIVPMTASDFLRQAQQETTHEELPL